MISIPNYDINTFKQRFFEFYFVSKLADDESNPSELEIPKERIKAVIRIAG